MTETVLEIRDLEIALPRRGSMVPVLRGVDLSVAQGEVVGLVGESGCGKSLTALACLGILPSGAQTSGRIEVAGTRVLDAPPREIRALRGGRCAMIFQDPAKALNPFFTIGRQLTDVIALHRRLPAGRVRRIAVESLEAVRMPDPEGTRRKYPHQLSGGQLQRVMIAMALTCEPMLLIADEPTTALDVTVQAQIVTLLRDLAREKGLSILFITHDLGVVASLCRRVAVMYAGAVVEEAACTDLFARPLHPYTQRLLATVPELGRGRAPLPHIPGQVPDLEDAPGGCLFHPRCDRATALCRVEAPLMRRHVTGLAACHRAGEAASSVRAREACT